jgi:hypothetical protein
METTMETLAAWVDGEPVKHAEVARALETSEGREYVIDLMALRRLVTGTAPAFDAQVTADLPRRRRWPALAAAAAALVCAVGGFAAGRFGAPSTSAPGAGMAPSAVTTSHTAPEPTRVIRLDEGADWRETVGGN